MHQISSDDVYRLLPIGECIDIVERAMIEVSQGRVTLPLRSIMPLGTGNAMGIMPGAMRDPNVHGIKLVSLYPDNPSQGLSSHQGVILLFDTKNGRPIAAVDGASVTAQRTAAATAAATRALARQDALVLAILGAGEQADHHLPALMAVRDFEEVRVWSRRQSSAEDFRKRHAERSKIICAETAEESVQGANVIVAVTASATPVLLGDWLQPGQHVNLVGASVATAREIDDEGIRRSRVFVDSQASAAVQAGELIDARTAGVIDGSHVVAEIGSVYAGHSAGRLSANEITIYKSLGVAAQDIAVAYEVYSRSTGADH